MSENNVYIRKYAYIVNNNIIIQVDNPSLSGGGEGVLLGNSKTNKHCDPKT